MLKKVASSDVAFFYVLPLEEGNVIELDKKLLEDIGKADVPWFRKKVKELFNEKDKWDKSCESYSNFDPSSALKCNPSRT